MKKVMKKLLLLTLAVVMGISVFACNKDPVVPSAPNTNPDPLPALNEYGRPGSGDFTYRRYTNQMPSSWSPFEWTTDVEQTILSFQASSIVTQKLKDVSKDDGEWEWEPAMATKLPEDVTKAYSVAGNIYGIPTGEESGYAYKITLRDDVKWDNGDPIEASDFVESLKLLIDPQYGNFRYNSYFQGSSTDIANLYEYYLSQEGAIMPEEGEEETPTVPDSNFDNVGFKALSKYELLLVFDGYNNELTAYNNMPSTTMLIHKNTFMDSLVELEGGLLKSRYMTNVSNSRSYGAYKLVSMQNDVEMVFAKNDKWYGWTDSKYNGQHWTTRIVYRIIKDSNTAMMEFKNGALDGMSLTATTYPEFADSSYILKYPSEVTFQLYLNSDLNKLNELETLANNSNVKGLKYLSNKDFRQALSYAINREELVSKATAGWEPASVLLNDYWEHDAGNNPGLKFRNTRPAMESLAKYYGISNYTSMNDTSLRRELAKYVSGYNKNEAVALFNKAVDALDGGVAPEKISIRVFAGDSDVWRLIINTMNNIIKDSTKGSKLEGKIEFVPTVQGADTAGDLQSGAMECWLGSYGYPYLYPDAQINFMVNPDFMLLTYGATDFLKNTNLTININGSNVVKTYQAWGDALVGGEYDKDINAKVAVMAEVERAFMEQAFIVPIASRITLQLNSAKIKQALTKHSTVFDYGGMRYFKYTFTDAQWDAYVATGKLDYTK